MFCQKCGTEIGNKKKTCPKCQTNIPPSKLLRIARTFAISMLLLLAFLIIIGIIAGNSPDSKKTVVTDKTKNASPVAKPVATKPAEEIVDYRFLNEELYDAPIKTQIIHYYAISGKPPKEQIEKFLKAKYKMLEKRSLGLEYHPHPNAIYIYLFPGKHHYDPNTNSQWYAMLSRSADDFEKGKEYTVTWKDDEYNMIGKTENPKSIYGLTVGQRKKEFYDSSVCEVQSNKLLNEDIASMPNDYSSKEEWAKATSKRADAAMSKCMKKVLKKYHITEKQNTEISVEGIQNHWEMSPTE